MAAKLKEQRGLFDAVSCKVLCNQEATRSAILDELKALVKRVKAEHAQGNLNLAVVSFAGHSQKDDTIGERFFFLPHDFDPDAATLDATGLSDGTLQEYLHEIPCPVVLVLDACYSGALRWKEGLRGGVEYQADEAVDALKQLKQAARGVVLIAACGANQQARELPEWGGGHGALTWALLESLSAPPQQGKILYLNDVVTGADRRLQDMLNKYRLRKAQSMVLAQSGNLPFGSIPIAYVGAEKKGAADKK